MVKIRLARIGKKNDPFYRIVATDERQKLTGRSIEVLGFWHPRTNLKKIDKKKVNDFVKKGAQVSSAVLELLK